MKRFAFVLLILLSAFVKGYSTGNDHSFAIGTGTFLLDGKPFRIISGEMHFARIPEACWKERLETAKAMGLNTIATYVFWNFHETEQGEFNFSGNADVAKFVRLAGEVGLWVIIRPSPYACAEWEFGGYPWWLQKEKDMKVRSRDERFIDLSRKYFIELGKQLAPLQITRGGPIIMVQLENEYGSYSNDKEYLRINKEIIRSAGFDVELYTCDGPSQMPAGYLPGIFPAVNGLDRIGEVKALIDKYNNGHGPYFIAEWYPAWFDSWGLKHHTVPFEECTTTLDSVLAAGYSINLYMMHGGTTRAFWNGANMDRRTPYSPQTSSYDYDAPMDEAGNPTPKYLAFREVIRRNSHPETVFPPVPAPGKTISINNIKIEQVNDLFNHLPPPVFSPDPLTFEALGQGYGYVLYRTRVAGPDKGLLRITHLRDYALIFVNGKRVAVLDRRLSEESVELDLPAGASTLDIFVENLGRINYGPYLNDNLKGITSGVEFAGKGLFGWSMYGFPMDSPPVITAGGHNPSAVFNGPVIRKGIFRLENTGNTWLDMRSFGKGCAWVNGHNLGRYWNIGPQQTLFIPAQWLHRGDNEIVIFEQLNTFCDEIDAIDHPILDQLNLPKILKTSLSTGKPVAIGSPYSPRYSAGGDSALTDGVKGSKNFADGCWQGYEGTDMICVVDLGEVTTITGICAGFLQNTGSWIFFPYSVEYYGSIDGVGYSRLGEAEIPVADSTAVVSVNDFTWSVFPETAGKLPDGQPMKFSSDDLKAIRKELAIKCRFIKVVARSMKTCPSGHPGEGKKAWLFADEISVE